MLIVIEHLIINADDITLIKGDFDVKEIKTSQFRLFKPRTWFLEPILEVERKYYFIIFYTKNGQHNTFKYMTGNSKSVQSYMDKIALQIKVQLKAQDQEMLDKVFENAIMEAQ